MSEQDWEDLGSLVLKLTKLLAVRQGQTWIFVLFCEDTIEEGTTNVPLNV